MDNPCATRTHDWGTDPSTGRPRCQRCWLFGDHPASVSEPAVEEALDVTPQYARAILRNTIASLRGVVASKKTEIAVQQGDLEAQHRSIESLRKQLATAEARGDADDAEAFRKGHAAGFRTAIERLEDYAVTQDAGGSMVVYHAQDFLRAQADRREGSDE